MKLALTSLILVLAAGSVGPAQAFPRGGWDGNDAHLTISGESKLLAPKDAAEAHPGGGWDLNDAKLSISKGSKLLPQAK